MPVSITATPMPRPVAGMLPEFQTEVAPVENGYAVRMSLLGIDVGSMRALRVTAAMAGSPRSASVALAGDRAASP